MTRKTETSFLREDVCAADEIRGRDQTRTKRDLYLSLSLSLSNFILFLCSLHSFPFVSSNFVSFIQRRCFVLVFFFLSRSCSNSD
jgi:hypothetical protein